MRSAEFLKLGRKEQENLLYERGVYIGKKKTEHYTVLLFQLDGFYVEVFYSRYRRVVAFMRATADPDVLDPYLTPFNMEELMSP